MPRRLGSLMLLICSLSCLLLPAGCQVLGVVADKVAPPVVEAQYDPGKTTQLLIVAENYRLQSQNTSDADRVAQLVGEELAREKAALIVSSEKLALVRDMKPQAFAKMSVVDLGKAVGAQKVLYIDMGGVAVGAQTGSDVMKGIASANVKVIDVATGSVAWPQDMAEGVPISFESPMRRATGRVTPDAIRAETLAGLSGKIARLFHKYSPSDLEALDPEL